MRLIPHDPTLIVNNPVNLANTKPELFGKLPQAKGTELILGTNLIDQFPSYFRSSVIFTAKNVSRKITMPIFRHVFHVLKVISKLQMSWINAIWNISPRATMKHSHSFWNGSNAENPSCSVGVNLRVDALLALNHSVPSRPSFSTRSCAASPNPVCVSDEDFRPESFWKRLGQSLRREVFGRNLDVCDVLHASYRLRAVTGRAGALLNLAQ